MLDLSDLPGKQVLGIAHPLRDAAGGFEYVDVLTRTVVYRFTADEIDGEQTDGGWTMDHYSLTCARVDTLGERVDTQGERQNLPLLPRVVLNVEQVLCDEWLGPVDASIPAYGENPRPLFDGPVGSAPRGTPHVTVARGIIVNTDGPSLLISTFSFPQQLDYTTDATRVQDFRTAYKAP